MTNVMIAASSQLAADAGAEVADEGGNAVDAAVAAALVSMCTDVTAVSMGASGFLTISPADTDPVVIDAHGEIPGRGLSDSDEIAPLREVEIGYGGSSRTRVGYSSVATPGALAGLALATERYGRLPWKRLVEPAIHIVRAGFPLPRAEDEYLSLTRELIFGWQPESRRGFHHEDGRPIRAGELMKIEGLDQTLEQIANEGVACIYGGSLGRAIADCVRSNGGRLTRKDMEEYQPTVRTPLRFEVDGWDVVTNPPPTVGGPSLAALLLMLARNDWKEWGPGGLQAIVDAQASVRAYRNAPQDSELDVDGALHKYLEAARSGELQKLLASPSTAHTSAVDRDGLGCAITLSIGYGSGVLVPGTGMWLNNALGEIELRTRETMPSEPGTRLLSNMSPTVARSKENVTLAIGASGAERIAGALAQVLTNFLWRKLSLAEAIASPRVHVEAVSPQIQVAHEPGLPVDPEAGYATRAFPDKDMFFGAVQAALWQPGVGLFAGVDPRRDGAHALGGTG